jgi:hypothetical protein
MGRPTTSDPRSRQLNLSLTESESESIAQRARKLGMRPAQFGRTALLKQDLKVVIAREPNRESEKLVCWQLSRLGNNLNQLVRHLHRTGDPLPADLEPLLKDIRQIIARGHRDDR